MRVRMEETNTAGQMLDKLLRQSSISRVRASRLEHMARIVERMTERENELQAEETSEKYRVEATDRNSKDRND